MSFPIRISAILALILAASGLAACSSNPDDQCKSTCEATNACPGVQQTDCAKACGAFTTANEITGCTSEYEAFMSCGSEVPDACKVTGDECSAELAAYEKCTKTFCAANADKCSGISMDGTGTSG